MRRPGKGSDVTDTRARRTVATLAVLATLGLGGCGSEQGERSDPDPAPKRSLNPGLVVQDPHSRLAVCLHSGLIPVECPPGTLLNGDRPQGATVR